MEAKDLMIGNWVYTDEITHYRMQVVNIDENGGVSLDFDGNEGDVFDCNVKDIEPIPVTKKWLELNGWKFESSRGLKNIENIMLIIYEHDFFYRCIIEEFGGRLKGRFDFNYVHELQNGIRFATKQDIELKF